MGLGKILCTLQRMSGEIAELEGIPNVQAEVILTEKKVKVTMHLGVAAGNIEVVSRSQAEDRSRSRAEGGRGWEMSVWRWQQGRRGDDLLTHRQGCCSPASGSPTQRSRVQSMA